MIYLLLLCYMKSSWKLLSIQWKSTHIYIYSCFFWKYRFNINIKYYELKSLIKNTSFIIVHFNYLSKVEKIQFHDPIKFCKVEPKNVSNHLYCFVFNYQWQFRHFFKIFREIKLIVADWTIQIAFFSTCMHFCIFCCPPPPPNPTQPLRNSEDFLYSEGIFLGV